MSPGRVGYRDTAISQNHGGMSRSLPPGRIFQLCTARSLDAFSTLFLRSRLPASLSPAGGRDAEAIRRLRESVSGFFTEMSVSDSPVRRGYWVKLLLMPWSSDHDTALPTPPGLDIFPSFCPSFEFFVELSRVVRNTTRTGSAHDLIYFVGGGIFGSGSDSTMKIRVEKRVREVR